MRSNGGFQARPDQTFVLLVLLSQNYHNMFVISRGFNIPGVEDSRIRKFLSPRRKDAKFGKEKIGFLRTFFTILFSDLCELSAFARDIPSFDCSCSPTASFPSEVWGKACATIRDNLRGSRKLSGSRDPSDSDIPRAKVAKVAKRQARGLSS